VNLSSRSFLLFIETLAMRRAADQMGDCSGGSRNVEFGILILIPSEGLMLWEKDFQRAAS
jgi:hypothetical protein